MSELSPRRIGFRGDAGFSVMELLVALVILGLVMALLPRTLSLASRAFRAADVVAVRSGEAAAVDFLAARLSETMPLYRRSDDGLLSISFYGLEQSISFVAPLQAGKDATGLARFTLQASRDSEGRDTGVELVWQIFRSENQPGQPPLPEHRRMLMPSSEGFQLRYRGIKAASDDAKVFAAADETAPSSRLGDWQPQWTRPELLPNEVEITYKGIGGRLQTRIVELKLVTQR